MERVIESIQTHLAKLAQEVNSGKTPLQEFVITKVTVTLFNVESTSQVHILM